MQNAKLSTFDRLGLSMFEKKKLKILQYETR